MENFDYRSGQLDLDGEFVTSGTGADLLLNLRSKGTFEGRGIVLAPDAEMRAVSGSYRVAASNGIPRLLLSNVQVSQGADTLTGRRLQPTRRPSGAGADQRPQTGPADRNAVTGASRTCAHYTEPRP